MKAPVSQDMERAVSEVTSSEMPGIVPAKIRLAFKTGGDLSTVNGP